MLQNPCKTLGVKKNMVCKIPPGGGGKPYPASGLICQEHNPANERLSIYKICQEHNPANERLSIYKICHENNPAIERLPIY